MNKIILVTSISPKEIENQQMALNSWINAGFDIISCNIKEEIESVKKFFPKVHFEEMKRDGRSIMGKPCPFIYDMFQVAQKHAEDICGIINSDIHLRKFTPQMYSYICKYAQSRVLFIRRNDVDTLEDINDFRFRMFFAGVDAFFFNKKNIDILEDDGLLIGQAMWDYWLPIMFYEKGIQINEIINPILFHIKHTLRWSDDITNDISWKICKKHFPQIERENAVYFLKDRFFHIISSLDMQICISSDSLKSKSVLIICKPEIEERINKQLCFQTHENVKLASSVKPNEEYDYYIKLPYTVSLCYSFIDNILWIMENYAIPAMKMMVYVRGNKTKDLHIDNCCNRALDRLNCDLQAITVKKKEYNTEEPKSPQICSTYCGSVLVEEDEQKIWKRDGFSGKTVVYPAGYMARLWVRRYRNIDTNLHLIGFADSSESMQNKIVEGLKVYGTDIVMQQQKYDKIVIVSNLHMEEIYDILRKNVPEEKLVVWNEFGLRNLIEG